MRLIGRQRDPRVGYVDPTEEERLRVLDSYCVLDTPPEPIFDDLTALGCALFQAPIVLISLVDRQRQFFKSAVGLTCKQLPHDSSFCAHTILGDGPLIVLNALEDGRFANNPLVLGEPHIRFYAGAALVGKEGMKLGSFCVIDRQPRAAFKSDQQILLLRFARLAVNALEQRMLPVLVSQAEREVQEASERYTLATRAASDGIWDWNCASGKVYNSARLRALIGAPEEEYWGDVEEWIERIHPKDLPAVQSNIQRLQTSTDSTFLSEYRIRHEDGSWRWIQQRGISLFDESGKLRRLVGAVTDITSSKIRDTLTGLHTRISLLDALDWRIRAEAQHDRSFAVFFIDLDFFERINDSFGHITGNLILIEFADALMYAYCIQFLLQAPLHCGNQQVQLSASIGIAMGGGSPANSEDLLQDADVAMYQAKTNGKAKSVLFSESMRKRAFWRMQIESELRDALAYDQLILHFQPKVILATGKVIGFEALIRWPHPRRGLISPDEFISVAEESDLILDLGQWTLGKAVHQLAEWRLEGIVSPFVTVAVNLSSKQFADRHLFHNIAKVLELNQLPASCLELEVTESVLIQDALAALVVLQKLKVLGVGLELDDFGTGYSSLSYLHRFPFDSLKVDKSFVNSLGEDSDNSTITRSIIALGRSLNLEVIAEGIEKPEHAKLLQYMGCLYGQGHLFSKPLPAYLVKSFLLQRGVIQEKLGSVDFQTGSDYVPSSHLA